MAKRLLLVRHGSPGPEYIGRYLGSTDVKLSAEGLKQAEAAALQVMKHQPGICLCSPLRRAVMTAEKITQESGLLTKIDQDLREIDFGRWEGMTFDQIAKKEPAAVSQWALCASGFAFPEGETLDGFNHRITAAADRLVKIKEKTVLVVAHGGVIRTMICYFLGLDPKNYILFKVKYAALAILDVTKGGRGVLSAFNIGAEDKG